MSLSIKKSISNKLCVVDVDSFADPAAAVDIVVPGSAAEINITVAAEASRTAAALATAIASAAPPAVQVGNALIYHGVAETTSTFTGVTNEEYVHHIEITPSENQPMVVGSLVSAFASRMF